MKVIAIVALLVAVASANPVRQSFSKSVGDIWTDCSQPSDRIKLNSVKITPDPLVKGGDISVTASFALNENVTGGNVHIEVKWGIIKVINQDDSLCTDAGQAGLKCPIQSGTKSITTTGKLPSDAPSGHYTGSIVAKDQSGDELFCVNLDFHL